MTKQQNEEKELVKSATKFLREKGYTVTKKRAKGTSAEAVLISDVVKLAAAGWSEREIASTIGTTEKRVNSLLSQGVAGLAADAADAKKAAVLILERIRSVYRGLSEAVEEGDVASCRALMDAVKTEMDLRGMSGQSITLEMRAFGISAETEATEEEILQLSDAELERIVAEASRQRGEILEVEHERKA